MSSPLAILSYLKERSTIHFVSDELLLLIFQKLELKDQRQCETVCRSWRSLAHITFLNCVYLNNLNNIKQFITSINSNPDPSYLNAVKEIQIRSFKEANVEALDKQAIYNLFIRFPNLHTVMIRTDESALLSLFDDEICNDLLRGCPKLENFEVRFADVTGTKAENYYTMMKNLAPIATAISFPSYYCPEIISKHGGVVNITSRFPRLKTLICHTCNNFQDIFGIFEHVDTIKNIYLEISNDVQRNFAELYLKKKTEQQRNTITHRLSKIKRLDVESEETFVNMAKFIKKYLTGLEEFIVGYSDDERWSPVQEESFNSDVMDIAVLAKTCSIDVDMMDASTFIKCFPQIARKLYSSKNTPQDRPPSLRNILYLEMATELTYSDKVSLQIRSSQYLRTVKASFHDTTSFQKFANSCKGSYSAYNSDTLVLSNPSNAGGCSEGIDMFNTIISNTRMMNHVVFDFPHSFPENQKILADEQVGFIAETVSIRAKKEETHQKLIEILTAFKKLKVLNLYDFSAVWVQGIGEFQVTLGEHRLEKLTLDMGHMKSKLMNYTAKFFIVKIELLSSNEVYMYKVGLGQPYPSRVDSSDLNSYVLGKDYIRISITASALQVVQLCAYSKTDDGEGIDGLDFKLESRSSILI